MARRKGLYLSEDTDSLLREILRDRIIKGGDRVNLTELVREALLLMKARDKNMEERKALHIQ